MKRLAPPRVNVLAILGDLLRGGRHSRRTVGALGVSYATADRWLAQIEQIIPGVRRFRIGKTTWYDWHRVAEIEVELPRKPRRTPA